jgi:hypothetical protein
MNLSFSLFLVFNSRHAGSERPDDGHAPVVDDHLLRHLDGSEAVHPRPSSLLPQAPSHIEPASSGKVVVTRYETNHRRVFVHSRRPARFVDPLVTEPDEIVAPMNGQVFFFFA